METFENMIETIVDENDVDVPRKQGNPAWVKGMQSPNPGGRPRDTMKEYLRAKLSNLTPEQKEQWLIENKVSGELQFRMAEGNPTEDRNIKVSVPTPILGGASAAITQLEGTPPSESLPIE